MRILISGSTGLVGSALISSLQKGAHQVTRLVRSKSDQADAGVYWNPEAGELATDGLEGLDAVVHLAGESIAEGRWTEDKKRRIRESRVKGTTLLCQTIAKLDRKPRVLISASAVGFYGNRGDEVLDEQSASGSDFLAEVCREWELATQSAAQAQVRVVNLRLGVILSSKGGALPKMLRPFKLGVGGKLGNGQQYMSWITLYDVVSIIEHAIKDNSLRGPVNAVAPEAVTNYTFTKTLGKVLSRPTIFPVPAFVARIVFGEMADATLLASQRVAPVRLQESGYVFTYPQLEGALRHVLDED